MKHGVAVVAAAVAVLGLAGCGSIKIGRINADPSRYQNRTVRVSGIVVNSAGVLGTGGYQIEDPTGRIYVLSATGVPPKGARVIVTGTVASGVQLLGRSFGTTIREQSHTVKH